MELLLGCGARRDKRVSLPPKIPVEWTDLVTLDMNPGHKPDHVWDMAELPLPFHENTFDEIHCYETLEHMGQQGDWRFFLAQFEDFWRIMKPGGLFVATTPHPSSPWAWGDPGHTRVIPPESLVFLSQAAYAEQVGVTPMTDYRPWYRGDFRILNNDVQHGSTVIILEALK